MLLILTVQTDISPSKEYTGGVNTHTHPVINGLVVLIVLLPYINRVDYLLRMCVGVCMMTN